MGVVAVPAGGPGHQRRSAAQGGQRIQGGA